MLEPPFLPDPHAVYAKDVLDIEQFSTVKGSIIPEKPATKCATRFAQSQKLPLRALDEVPSTQSTSFTD